MTRRELDAMPEDVLRTTAVRAGVRGAYDLARGRLTDATLAAFGEAAGDTPAGLRAEVEALRAEVADMRQRLGRALTEVDVTAARALWIAESSMAANTAHRAPTPEEVAALGDAALRRLAGGLGAGSADSRAEMLDRIATKMGWNEWRDAWE